MAAVDWQAVKAAIGRLEADWTDALAEYCAIPSEGGHAEDLERAAEWTKERLEKIGATTRVIRVDGAPPLVVGGVGVACSGSICARSVRAYSLESRRSSGICTKSGSPR